MSSDGPGAACPGDHMLTFEPVPIASVKRRMSELRRAIEGFDEQVGPLSKEASELVNVRWGPPMRAGNDKSHLARQVERGLELAGVGQEERLLERVLLEEALRDDVEAGTHERRQRCGWGRVAVPVGAGVGVLLAVAVSEGVNVGVSVSVGVRVIVGVSDGVHVAVGV